MRPGLLALSDGTTFRGISVGADGLATGEVVFNTSMTGYVEVASDPSYAGQMIVMTAPHIGNYGVSRVDEQSVAPWCTGFVMRSMSARDSSWRSEGAFGDWLTRHGIVAISEIDTRRLTRHIRSEGAMPAAIGSGVSESEVRAGAAAAPTMEGRDLTELVTTPRRYLVEPEQAPVATVVAYDFGMKRDILAALVGRGIEVHVVPASTAANEVLALDPDGVFLSNGPGDPEPLSSATGAVRALLGKVPIFGICLGHQVLGRALGAGTFKLPFGHHGGNHPVRRIADGRVHITSQNHGFAVDLGSLLERDRTVIAPRGAQPLPERVESEFGTVEATHMNLNDGTLEGLACRDIAAFSVQYHPEAAPGPREASVLFDRFIAMIGVAA